LDIPEVVAIVGTKIYWEDVPASNGDLGSLTRMPYITIGNPQGGYEDRTHEHAVDIYLDIRSFSSDKSVAQALRVALGKIHYKDLIVTAFTDVYAYGGVRLEMPRYRKDEGQTIPIYEVSVVVRLQFIINGTI
jgi:hypothetical protein